MANVQRSHLSQFLNRRNDRLYETAVGWIGDVVVIQKVFQVRKRPKGEKPSRRYARVVQHKGLDTLFAIKVFDSLITHIF